MRATVTLDFPHPSVTQPLPTLTDLFQAVEPEPLTDESRDGLGLTATQDAWRAVIGTMTALLNQRIETSLGVNPYTQSGVEICRSLGVIFCSPVPVFSDLGILAHFKTWIFTSERQSGAFQLPPAVPTRAVEGLLPTILLRPNDPLLQEQFCLVQTASFAWVAILGRGAEGNPQLNFSFDPHTVEQIWQALQGRINHHPQAIAIQDWRSQFPVLAPDYHIPLRFSQALLRRAVQSATTPVQWATPSTEMRSVVEFPGQEPRAVPPLNPEEETDPDVELLKVLAHEVRTPLTTIQTLTRLLLRRSDLPKEVLQRLEAIQRECSGQIDRFGLIFRAVELTREDSYALPVPLTPIALQTLLADNLSRWQTHTARRGLTLQVSMPKRLPNVVIRDPHLLDQVLTGLVEYLTYSLPVGSHIHLKVALAGSQLKLQLQTQPSEAPGNQPVDSPMLKAVGQLLLFQPETGGVSLSLSATKHLFQALGGKLTVRKHRQGEVLTIFLPLGTEGDAY